MRTPEPWAYLAALAELPGVGPARLEQLVAHFGSPVTAWEAPASAWLRVEGFSRPAAEQACAARRPDAPRRLAQAVRAAGARAITPEAPGFPPLLRLIPDPPPVLYVKGELPAPAEMLRSVAIVGTRRPGLAGLQAARRFAIDLAQAGVVVVSGMARGIDAAAHEGCLQAGGRTVAVLACGVDRPYPPSNLDLAEAIGRAGALVSEYPPGTAPEPFRFPQRNRLISGMVPVVLVIEAGPKSGALITADRAGEQGRAVMAVPGDVLRPSTQGSNELLQQGAHPALSGRDVLDLLGQEVRRLAAVLSQRLEPAPQPGSQPAAG